MIIRIPAILITVVLTAVIMAVAACGERSAREQSSTATATPTILSSEAATPTAASKPSDDIKDLRDIAELRSLFNESDGVPRVILLLAPT